MTARAARRLRRGPRITPRPALAKPGAWAKRALCADADPDLWFPDEQDHATAAAAVAVCARCLVRDQCLAHALAIREPRGIWGGLTAEQRRRLLAGRRGKGRVA